MAGCRPHFIRLTEPPVAAICCGVWRAVPTMLFDRRKLSRALVLLLMLCIVLMPALANARAFGPDMAKLHHAMADGAAHKGAQHHDGHVAHQHKHQDQRQDLRDGGAPDHRVPVHGTSCAACPVCTLTTLTSTDPGGLPVLAAQPCRRIGFATDMLTGLASAPPYQPPRL
jgi:hypothetical protein